MAADDEVVVSESSVPVRVARGDEADVVPGNVLEWVPGAVVDDVGVGGDGLDADGDEEEMGLFWIGGSEFGDLDLVNDDAFDPEDSKAFAVVEEWGVSLLVDVYLQQLLHLQVAPALHH